MLLNKAVTSSCTPSVVRLLKAARFPAGKHIDLSRGAAVLFKLGGQVHLDPAVLANYAELDPALGRNTAGCVLSVLAQHLRDHPGGGGDEVVAVALIRRADEREVEVYLNLTRSRKLGQECLALTFAADRELD